MNTALLPSMPTAATMSSLTIAEITGKRHNDVIRDICNVLEQAEIEAAQFCAPFKMPSGQMATVYELPRRECDLVISGYSVKYRLAIIDRWHDLEAKQAFKIPQTLSEALRLSADLADKVNEQSVQLAIAAPKVEFYDTVTESDSVCQMAIAAQVAKLPFGRNTLFQKLREIGAFITGGERHNMPYQDLINRGLFTVNQKTIENPKTGAPIIVHTSYATQKGIAWIISKFGGQEA
jgi:anti-repressor protein